jgi:hypothetical protein
MQAQALLDNWINNLKLTNEKLGTLVLTLDTSVLELEKLDETEGGREKLRKEVERSQKRVDYQNCQIEDYHELAKEGKVKFEKICQDFEILSNRVLGEEKKVFLFKRIVLLLEHYLPTFKEAYPIKFLLQHCLQIWSIN